MRKFEIKGVGNDSMTFYPLTIDQMSELDEEMKAFFDQNRENAFSPERFNKLTKIYLASARRGDPNITESQVRAFVDMGNIPEINRAILGLDPATALPTARANGVADQPVPTSPQTGGASARA